MIIYKVYQPLAFLTLAFLIVFLLTACAYMPAGPSMMASASPGSGKNFDQFRNDDYNCRQFAHEQVSGISAKKTSAWIVQQQYDFRYLQCMYAHHHLIVPEDGQVIENSTKSEYSNPIKSILTSPPK